VQTATYDMGTKAVEPSKKTHTTRNQLCTIFDVNRFQNFLTGLARGIYEAVFTPWAERKNSLPKKKVFCRVVLNHAHWYRVLHVK